MDHCHCALGISGIGGIFDGILDLGIHYGHLDLAVPSGTGVGTDLYLPDFVACLEIGSLGIGFERDFEKDFGTDFERDSGTDLFGTVLDIVGICFQAGPFSRSSPFLACKVEGISCRSALEALLDRSLSLDFGTVPA